MRLAPCRAVCQVYNGSRQSGVRKLDNVNLNLGMCYLYIGSLIPEVAAATVAEASLQCCCHSAH